MRKKYLYAVYAVITGAVILAGCGSGETSSASDPADNEASEEASEEASAEASEEAAPEASEETSDGADSETGADPDEVRTVYVGVGATFEPYCYIDEDNKPAGYDVAVLEEIDARLPQYEFVIENMELSNILVSLDTGKVSIGSQQFERNPEREEKYLFTNEGIGNYDKRIVYKAGRTDIHSIDDLAGLRVSATLGSNTATILQQFNDTHDEQIEIVYDNGATSESIYDDIMNGRLDAMVSTRKVYNRDNEAFGGGYEINEDSLFSESDAYYMLAQGEEQLRDDIDEILKEMKEDGTLTEISIEYTGSDYDAEE